MQDGLFRVMSHESPIRGEEDQRLSLQESREAELILGLIPVLDRTARALGAGADADDLVQETLIRVLMRYPRFAGLAHPLAYCKTVLVRLAARGSRRRIREGRELPEALALTLEAAEGPESAVLGRLAVADALRRLSRRQRACVYLSVVEGLSDDQISVVLDCRWSTVRSQLSRGLQTLRIASGRRAQAEG